MAGWNHKIEKIDGCPQWMPNCNGRVGKRPCPGKIEYKGTFLYVTGKGGRVTERKLYFCEQHAMEWAEKHGVGRETRDCEKCCEKEMCDATHRTMCDKMHAAFAVAYAKKGDNHA
jgi:hypothetical protein